MKKMHVTKRVSFRLDDPELRSSKHLVFEEGELIEDLEALPGDNACEKLTDPEKKQLMQLMVVNDSFEEDSRGGELIVEHAPEPEPEEPEPWKPKHVIKGGCSTKNPETFAGLVDAVKDRVFHKNEPEPEPEKVEEKPKKEKPKKTRKKRGRKKASKKVK